ncbi:MAG: hypothetical protein KGL57_08700 [Burkholderiales bacterium]|nr:hypothetical protein [Burkholderiales bacterium]
MDAPDAAVSPSSVIPEWCNPGLLAEEAQPLPAGARIDWLKPAMSIWCDPDSDTPRKALAYALPISLNS